MVQREGGSGGGLRPRPPPCRPAALPSGLRQLGPRHRHRRRHRLLLLLALLGGGSGDGGVGGGGAAAGGGPGGGRPSSQSLDPVAHQRRLVRDVPRAVAPAAGHHQQQQQGEEDGGAQGHHGVGDDPQQGLVQGPPGAVRPHVGRREGPGDLRQRRAPAHYGPGITTG